MLHTLVVVQGPGVHNLCSQFDFPGMKTRFQRCLDMGRKQSGFSKASAQLIPRGLSFITVGFMGIWALYDLLPSLSIML